MDWHGRPFRVLAALAAGVAGSSAVAGCSVASGPAAGNAALGPVRVGRGAGQFAAFPVPSAWEGLHGRVYQVLLKPDNGTTARTLRVTAASSMVVWLNCIGAGDVTLDGGTLGLYWSLPCGNGSDPQGVTLTPPRGAVGQPARILVTVSPGSRWEVRIDGIAPAGAAS